MTGEGPAPRADDRVNDTRGLPVLPPISAVAEIVILLALIYGIDQLTPGVSVLDLSPHPFWIPVLLVSLQYGTVSGFIAAAVAIGLSLFAGLPEQDIGENLFAYFLRVFGQPILWIGVALLVGQFRMRQLGAKEELRIANKALTAQRDDLARHSRRLRDRVEHLEQELTTRYGAPPHAIAAVLAETMAQGGFFDERARQAILQRATAALFPEAVVTAYRARDGFLAECAVSGRKPDTGPRIRISLEDPLYRLVVEEGRGVSVLDAGGEDILGTTGLAAEPIWMTVPEGSGDNISRSSSAHETCPFGMLVIERAGPAEITRGGMLALQLLAHALQPRPPRPIVHQDVGLRPALRHTRAPKGHLPRPTAAIGTAPPGHAHDRRKSLAERLLKASAPPDAPQGAHSSVSLSKPGEKKAPVVLRDDNSSKATGVGKAPGEP